MKTFFSDNKVFLSGLAAAIIIVLQQYIAEPHLEIKPLLLALAISVGGYVGNQFRGKGISIAGLIGAAGNAFATVAQTGYLSWNSFIISLVIGLLALVAPPAKRLNQDEAGLQD